MGGLHLFRKKKEPKYAFMTINPKSIEQRSSDQIDLIIQLKSENNRHIEEVAIQKEELALLEDENAKLKLKCSSQTGEIETLRKVTENLRDNFIKEAGREEQKFHEQLAGKEATIATLWVFSFLIVLMILGWSAISRRGSKESSHPTATTSTTIVDGHCSRQRCPTKTTTDRCHWRNQPCQTIHERRDGLYETNDHRAPEANARNVSSNILPRDSYYSELDQSTLHSCTHQISISTSYTFFHLFYDIFRFHRGFSKRNSIWNRRRFHELLWWD